MKNLTSLLILAALLIGMPGCASKDTLHLSNIFDDKSERALLREEKDRENQLKAEEAAKVIPAPKPPSLEALIESSTTNPPELALLKIPDGFIEMTPEEQSLFQEEQIKRPNLSGFIPQWRDKNSLIYILVDKSITDRESITAVTREEFRRKIRFGVERYEEFYRETHHAKITFNESSLRSLITLQIASRYLYNGDWHADDRQTFFYTPDYRLNLLITGPDEELLKIRKELDENIQDFREKLALYFPAGIPFKAEQT